MKRALTWGLAVVGGLALGVGSALGVARGALGDSSLTNAGWSTNLTIGSDVASPWVRARIALVGLLALNKKETVYFDRKHDDQGAPLRAGCTYALAGSALPARWWSITLYDDGDMLARNTDAAASLDLTRLGPQDWEARISPQPPQTPNISWLSSRNSGDFSLTLRLYNPQDSTAEGLSALSLPRVTRIACNPEEASR